MTTVNSGSSFGENLLINLNAANTYSYNNILTLPIENKTFVRFLSNYNLFVDFNFITNAYVYDALNPTILSFSKTAYIGKEEIWYRCDNRITQVIATVNNTFSPLLSGEVVSIVCEFIDFIPKDLQDDV